MGGEETPGKRVWTEEDRDVVLKKGPFAVYGKRMFLEPPPKEFSEAYEDYRFLPMERNVDAGHGNENGDTETQALVATDVCEAVVGDEEDVAEKRTDEAALVVVEDGTGVQDIVATPLQQPFGTPQVEVQSPPPPLEIGDEAANETSDAEIPQVEVQSPPPPPEIEEEAGNDKEEAALSKSARRKARKARKAAEAALNPPCNLETVSEVDPDPQAENEEENVVTLPIEPSRVVAGARRRSPQSKKQKKTSRTSLPLGINKVAGGGVWDFVWNNKLSVIALLETKLSIEKADLFVKNRKNGWKLATNFHDTVGGRILVTWNPALVDCSILETGPQHVHCLILCKISQKKILCTFVYGLFSVVARRQLWEKIEALGLLIVEPWVISGDFNTVLSPSERRGGNEPTRYELQDLENCCANMDLTDCPSTGKFFTWRNRYMEAKLDRVLINDRWGANGLTCMADFKLLACNSDHCPVVITTSIAISDGKRPFKFLNMWLTHQDFKVTLENVWREHVEGSKQYILAKKLKSLKGPLRTLNRNAFSHISERTRVAKEAYSVAQDELDVLNANEQERAYVNDLRKRALFLMEAERRERNGTDNTYFGHGSNVSADQALNLVAPISKEEIKEALFSMGNDKAPGPDGYTAAFFKVNWNRIGSLVIAAVMEFFRNGQLLKQWNHTVIALIPKKMHDQRVEDFRPIACCNVFYKIITKIIAARMGRVLPDIVDQAQGAFVGGRSVSDNVMLAQELIRGYSRKRISPRCMIMVDIRKAYDTVSWDFLKEVLHGFGFPSIFTEWIMECVSTASFSVSINGTLHGKFDGRRGLRGDVSSVGIMMNALNELEGTSGLAISATKSKLFCAGVRDDLSFTRIPNGTLPVRYLGVPLDAQKLKVSCYTPLFDSINKYISAWKGFSLSYAGKLELIAKVIQGVVAYWMQEFSLPPTVIESIISICRKFLWGGKRALVSWDVICRPKDEGGLGLRNLKHWNNAFMTKTLWNIHTRKETLWIRWVHDFYLRNVDFWTWNPGRNESALMRSLAKVRDLLVSRFGTTSDCINKLASWNGPNGINTSAVYEAIRPQSPKKFAMRFIWKSFVPPKFAFCTWLCLHGRLLTKSNVIFMEIDKHCSFCGATLEDINHLFFMCPFSKQVWDRVRDGVGIARNTASIKGAIKWHHRDSRGTRPRSKIGALAIMASVFHLWKTRNALYFDQMAADVDRTSTMILKNIFQVMYRLYPNGWNA
ncbi:PREDICTED: uncharacterized protein LOC109177999 [Ipomoea nil]|uniref:uncharacterized protein LOC109177999 n=1 Tax=Ipomoea nil TaxID=35883 RepID=UPI0009016B58|nr:PREDICTED: uncharacterized protein LOC109177999 [Ipomoea nil]